MLQTAVRAGKVCPRDGKRQFEVFSADFMLDEDLTPWLLEFNMSPVLRDDSEGLGFSDERMISGALSLVIPWEGGDPELWDQAFALQMNDADLLTAAKMNAEAPITEGE